MKIIIAILYLAAAVTTYAGMTAEEILKIAAEPASEGVPEEFSHIPKGSEFRVTITPKEGATSTPTTARAKFVRGRYFVVSSDIDLPDDQKGKIVIVTTFDKEAEVYRKCALVEMPWSKDVVEFVGNLLAKERVMHWVSIPKEPGQVVSSLESFGENEVLTKEIIVEDGKVVAAHDLTAKKVR